MATKRRLDIEIGSEAKGDGFDKTGKEADRLGEKLKGVGRDAAKGLGDAEQEVDKLGDKLRSAGKKAGDSLQSGLSSALGNVGSAVSSGFDIGSLTDSLSGSIEGLGGALGPAGAAAGMAIGGALAVGLLNGMETEVAGDRLAAQLGGSEWAMEMGEVAGDLYTEGFGESVNDTAAAVRDTLRAGLLPEDATNAQIEAMTSKLMTFTDVLEQDVPMATQAASNMIRTGIAQDGAQAFDILTRGIQQGGDRAGDLLETFQEYSTMFRDIGISGAEATGLIVQGLAAGARDADTVADALKEFAIRAQDGSEASARGFELIGLSASDMTAAVAAGGPAARGALDQVLEGLQNMEDPVLRNEAAVALFGTKAEDLGDALFSLDLDTAASRLGTVEGATDGLGIAYDNASSKIETFKRQALEKLTEFIGNSVLPKVESFTNWARENPGALQAIAVVIGLITAALAALAIAAGIASISLLPITLPMVLIAAAVVALIAVIALLAIHWDTVAAAAGAAWDFIWEKASAAFNWIKDNWPLILAILTGPIGLAVLAITSHWDTIKNGFTAVKDWIGDRVEDVVGFFTGLPGRISAAVVGLWDGLTSTFRSAINRIIGWWNTLSFTIGGGTYDPLGMFGPSITVPAFTFSTPDIPLRLADGGIVRHKPGGTIARIGEAGQDEAVVPLPRDGSLGGDTYIENHYHIAGSVWSERELIATINRAGDKGIKISKRAVRP